MGSYRRPMRYAHNDGHTDVCFSSDGKTIATCGSDGDVRLWEGLEDDDPTSQCVGEQALAVAMHKDHLYVGTDNNNVQSYTFPGDPTLERDGIISRFTSPVTHIAVSKDGNLIASGSCDMEIQLKNVGTNETIVFSGHKSPILGVALDPQEKYLASSSCDGTIRIWTIETEHRTVKTWTCVPVCNSFFSAKCLARVSWHPISGRFIAIPDATNIVTYARDTWERVFVLSDHRITNPFSITAVSPCGNYLAASTIRGDICVWNLRNQAILSYTTHDRGTNISGLAWNPMGIGQIAFCDFTGQLGTVEKCISTPDSAQELLLVKTKVNGMDKEHSVLNDDDDGEDDNFDLDFSEKINGAIGYNDDGRYSKLSLKDLDDDTDSRVSRGRPISTPMNLQEPFQPGSTPDHLQHRYLMWNSVGIIRCRNIETENSIDVEFNDTSVHHALHFNNYMKHTLGALTEKAVVLACEAQDDVPSKLVCLLVNAWDGQKEWTMSLPEDEEALSLAAGCGWVGVATDARNLRLVTLAGMQREVIALPGPIVSMAGQGTSLIVVCHAGIGAAENQNLIVSVLRVSVGGCGFALPWQPLPLSPVSRLQWLGFTDEASPTTLDSRGILRLLTSQGFWSPIADMQKHVKGKSDHCFVIGLSERYRNIRCVLCRGSFYPPTAPKPIITELEMQIPLCEDTLEKTQLEEKFWLNQLIAPSLSDAFNINPNYASDVLANKDLIKTTLLKMFALATKSGLQQQALELSGFMPQQMEQLVIKYASKLSKYILADKLRERSNIQRSFGDAYDENFRREESPIPESESPSNVHTKNIILAARQNQAAPVKAKIVNSGTVKNPFRKEPKKPDGLSGLERLTATIAEKAAKQHSTPQPAVKLPKSRQMKLASLASSKAANGQGEMTFVQWYATKKAELAEEFPDLSDGELTKQAMKRFKEEKEDKSNEEKDTQETQASSPQRDETLVESAARNEENKKRKIDDVSAVEENGTKKVSSSSKLMAFAFKKS